MVTKKKNNLSEPRKIKGAEISQILQICTDVNREVTVSGLLSKNLTMTLLFIFFFVTELFQETLFCCFLFFFFSDGFRAELISAVCCSKDPSAQ